MSRNVTVLTGRKCLFTPNLPLHESLEKNYAGNFFFLKLPRFSQVAFQVDHDGYVAVAVSRSGALLV